MIRTAFTLLFSLFIATAALAQQRVIKDPAEYKAYMAAYETKDAGARAGAMEEFARRYPESAVRLDALEQALAGFQSVGNRTKVASLSAELLKVDPDNLRALALQVYLLRARATADDAAAMVELRPAVARGLTLLAAWRKPAGLSDAEAARLKTQVGIILNGAAGFVALQDKEPLRARPRYLEAVAADPNDLQNVYQLALTCLEVERVEPDGFWYAARAIALAGASAAPAVQDQIRKYAAAKYKSFHGSEDGWSDIVARAAKAAAKPPGFTVKPAP